MVTRRSRVRGAGEFRARYGPWALITGGSEGVGGSWASAIAARIAYELVGEPD